MIRIATRGELSTTALSCASKVPSVVGSRPNGFILMDNVKVDVLLMNKILGHPKLVQGSVSSGTFEHPIPLA